MGYWRRFCGLGKGGEIDWADGELRDVLIEVIENVKARDKEAQQNNNPLIEYEGTPRLLALAEALLQLVTSESAYCKELQDGKS
jgi:hypothetical protein